MCFFSASGWLLLCVLVSSPESFFISCLRKVICKLTIPYTDRLCANTIMWTPGNYVYSELTTMHLCRAALRQKVVAIVFIVCICWWLSCQTAAPVCSLKSVQSLQFTSLLQLAMSGMESKGHTLMQYWIMCQERLDAMLILYCNSDIDISPEELVEQFAQHQARCILLVNPLD